MPANPEPQGVARVVHMPGFYEPFEVFVGRDSFCLYKRKEDAESKAAQINTALAPLLESADRMAEALEKVKKLCIDNYMWPDDIRKPVNKALSAYRLARNPK